jgi:hypothetical protein
MEPLRDEVRSAKSEKEGAVSFVVSALKFGFPVVGKGQGSLVAPEAIGVSPYRVWRGSVGVSGVWIGARKLEGELDVGGRRIFMTHRGIHSSHCGTSRVLDSTKFVLPIVGRQERGTFTGGGWFHCSLT